MAAKPAPILDFLTSRLLGFRAIPRLRGKISVVYKSIKRI